MESLRKPKASPEEIKSALHAADIVAREKVERNRKEQAERDETMRLSRLMLEEQAKNVKPHEITAEDVKEAEEAVGKKFERLN